MGGELIRKMGTLIARVVLALSTGLGLSSLLVFAVFLFWGPLNLVNVGLDAAGVLLWDAALCFAFFVQHSGMVRKGFRRQLTRFIPDTNSSAVYAIVSSVFLFAVVGLWQESPQVVIDFPGILQLPFRAAFFLALAGFVWGIRALRQIDPFATRPIHHALRGTVPRPVRFTVNGPYRWVRHPLYFFTAVMIWSNPHVTADRLLFCSLWTIWIVCGTIFEERDLVAEFGKAYRSYQERVPMLIPWKGRAI